MVCGAGGGYRGPGGGAYARVAETLKGQGISTLRLNYRQPNLFPECVLDLLAGIIFLGNTGYRPRGLDRPFLRRCGGHRRRRRQPPRLRSGVLGLPDLRGQHGGNAGAQAAACGPRQETTPVCPIVAASRFTSGPTSRKSWCFTTTPSTGWRNAGPRWKSCCCGGSPRPSTTPWKPPIPTPELPPRGLGVQLVRTTGIS